MSTALIGIVGLPDGWSSQVLRAAFRDRGCTAEIMDFDKAVFDSADGTVRCGQDMPALNECDAVVVKKLSSYYDAQFFSRIDLLDFIAAQGTPIFSPPAALRRCYSRQSNTLTLMQAGIPMPRTLLTESSRQAMHCIEELGAAVVKPLFTSKARGMAILRAGDPNLRSQLVGYKREFGPFYLQELIELPDQDLGVVFCGGQYLATYARRKTDATAWNTTTASGGKYVAHEPSAEVVAIAEKAQAAFGMSFTCVDVAETAAGPMVFEVSAFGGFRGLQDACAIDAAAVYADYVLKDIQ